jgi:hypothetical protein
LLLAILSLIAEMSRWEHPGVKGIFQVGAMLEFNQALLKTDQEWVESFTTRLEQRASTKP